MRSNLRAHKLRRDERKLLHEVGRGVVVTMIIMIICSLVTGLIAGHEYRDVTRFYEMSIDAEMGEYEDSEGDSENETSLFASLSSDDIEVRCDENDVISVDSVEVSTPENVIRYRVRALKPGEVLVSFIDRASGFEIANAYYRVNLLREIHNDSDGNFPLWRLQTLYVLLATAACAVILWWAFVRAERSLRYSYVCIFYAGFAVWVSVIASLLAVTLSSADSVYSIYSIVKSAGFNFMMVTAPFCLIYAVLQVISNVQLLRREGIGFNNALGIGFAGLIVVGYVPALVIYMWPFQGSMQMLKILNAVQSSYTSLYVLLECFMIGSIVCGLVAARHKLRGPVDYIVILGCSIRPDGTLYPLIKGRVDAALKLRARVLEESGHAPILVPSGGQGLNEVMSEAEAMARYLREQDVPDTELMLEDKSTTTRENFAFSHKLISNHWRSDKSASPRVAYATSNYHVLRSGCISREADDGFAPEGVGAPTKWYFWPNAFVREMLGMVVYMRRPLLVLLFALVVFFVTLTFVIPM